MSDKAPHSTDHAAFDGDRASRIYLLPNLLTAGNLFCGFLAIICCIEARFAARVGTDVASLPDFLNWTGLGGRFVIDGTPQQLYTWAVWFIIAAVVCDSLDGRLARLGGRESLFGREFDSIADVVSFGVAPALLVFFLILSPELNPVFRRIGWFVGFIYLLCAGVRLARFNVITHPLVHSNSAKFDTKDFVGLPVPAAAGMIVSLALLIKSLEDFRRWMLILPILMLFISFLMVSTIRYPSFKQIDWTTKTRFSSFLAVLILGAFLVFFHEVGLVAVFLGYLIFGTGRHLVILVRRRKATPGRLQDPPALPVNKVEEIVE